MALELLSGPHDIVDINDADAPIVLGTTVTTGQCQWVDPIGFVGKTFAGTNCIAQMDGSGVQHALNPSSSLVPLGLSLVNASPLDPTVGSRWYSYMLAGADTDDELEFDRVTRAPGRVLTSNEAMFAASNYARLADRYISVNASKVQTAAFGGSVLTDECNLVGISLASSLSWAREPERVWIGSANGEIGQYDHVSKAQVGSVYKIGMACVRLWYSAKHDVFISVHNTGAGVWQLRVWARTVLPVSVFAPVAESALNAGRVVSLKCRVLGADGDACEGEVVSWSLTGPGALSPLTSLTDATGWARTNYYVPLGASGSADIDVEVSV